MHTSEGTSVKAPVGGGLGLPQGTSVQPGGGDSRSRVGSSQGWRCRGKWEGSKWSFWGGCRRKGSEVGTRVMQGGNMHTRDVG